MKTKNIIIYIIFCIIILVSFKLPETLLKIVEINIEKQIYEKEKIESTIDVETEKIYLVKAIHNMENENSTVEIASNFRNWVLIESLNTEKDMATSNNIDEEMLKLKQYNILNDFEVTPNSKYSIGIINKMYLKGNEKYIINNISLKKDDKQYNLEIENKTGKILNITIEKDDLYTASTKEEIMNNYIRYLDLYIIDDWIFQDNMLKSKKANLVINLEEKDDKYTLSIHSENRIYNTFEITSQ